MTEQGASGRLFVRLFRCCHVGHHYHACPRVVTRFGRTAGRPSVSCETGSLLALGGVYFVGLLKFNREVLETEPGDVSVFKH